MGQKKKSAAPTKSFDQMVADAQIKRLEPLVKQYVAAAMQGATQAIYRFVMSERAAMQSRQLGFERLLKANTTWFTEAALALAVATVEDESQGLVPSTEPVKVGDKVRANLYVKNAETGEYGIADKLAIHQVGVKGPTGTLQTDDTLETAVTGMTVGESKEFDMTETEEGGTTKTLSCRIEIVAVSCAPATEGQPA